MFDGPLPCPLPSLKKDRHLPHCASHERVRGVGWLVCFFLIGWLLGALLLGGALKAGFLFFSSTVLEKFKEHPVALTVLLLVVQGCLIAAWSFITAVGQALITRRIYLIRSEQLGVIGNEELPAFLPTEQSTSPWTRRLVYLAVPIVLLPPLVLWAELSRHLPTKPSVQVTAHRGHARAAPENTLSAIRKAIESGADFAEVDVQLTRDGVIVLLHDSDLKRVAGVPQRLDEMAYDEVRKLDVGSWFDASFASERVPTLAQVIDLSRGRIKLNIELKLYGPDGQLAEDMARLIREQNFESDCIVTSFDYDALQRVKQHNPRVRTGLIIAKALGDVSRLDLDALSVRADWLTDSVLREAQRRGLEVHVWTVNDPRQMNLMIKRGVDNILTSDPDQLIQVRDEWAQLSETERLLLASRLLLGLD